jgi:hypothetical protein
MLEVSRLARVERASTNNLWVGVEENFVCCRRCPACLCVCFAGFCDSLLGSRVLIGSILVGRLGRSGAHDQQLGLS